LTGSSSKPLVAIEGHPDVFTLHLLGQMEMALDIPDELRNIVQIHSDVSYDDFYRILASMDLLLPAFASLHYLRDKTSSSIPAAVLSRVPILGSALAVKVYEFLRPPAIVPYPAGLSEVESIKLLREGKDLWDVEQDLCATRPAPLGRLASVIADPSASFFPSIAQTSRSTASARARSGTTRRSRSILPGKPTIGACTPPTSRSGSVRRLGWRPSDGGSIVSRTSSLAASQIF
jgi:hypothetical protein